MIVESAPQYGVARNGLGANYTINFGSDVAHQIPLMGMWQGDAVKAKTLFIDNYSNQYAITVTDGNFTEKIPAFAAGYVDISQSAYVNVTAESIQAGNVNMSVWNFVEKYRIDTRTFQPNSLTNDPYWSKVNFASHCEGVNGAGSIFDEKSQTYLAIGGATSISTVQSKFGTASILQNGNPSSTLVLGNNPTITFSWDFFFYIPSGAYANNDYDLIGSNGVTYHNLLGFRIAAGQITSLLYQDDFPTAKIVAPAQIAFDTWHYLALNHASGGGTNVFIDGSIVMSNVNCGGYAEAQSTIDLGNFIGFFPGANGVPVYFDEMRFTSYPRFISTAPVPTQPFLSQ